MKRDFSITPYQIKVEKPWGYELILTQEGIPYTGKVLHLNQGARFSLQYHDQKMETLTLASGRALLIIEDEKGKIGQVEMVPKKGYLIKPFQKHRVKGITDCDILETSTAEVGKTVRLEDDYARGTETEKERKTRTKGGVYRG